MLGRARRRRGSRTSAGHARRRGRDVGRGGGDEVHRGVVRGRGARSGCWWRPDGRAPSGELSPPPPGDLPRSPCPGTRGRSTRRAIRSIRSRPGCSGIAAGSGRPPRSRPRTSWPGQTSNRGSWRFCAATSSTFAAMLQYLPGPYRSPLSWAFGIGFLRLLLPSAWRDRTFLGTAFAAGRVRRRRRCSSRLIPRYLVPALGLLRLDARAGCGLGSSGSPAAGSGDGFTAPGLAPVWCASGCDRRGSSRRRATGSISAPRTATLRPARRRSPAYLGRARSRALPPSAT